MKTKYLFGLSFIVFHLSFSSVAAQTGAPYIHDPSTIVESEGKYFTFGTGGGGLMSDDGWSWSSGADRPGGGAAPDIMKIGDRYLCIYGATGGGLFGGHNGRILTMWNDALDPQSPKFKWTTAIEVASSDGMEDCDAIGRTSPSTARHQLSSSTTDGTTCWAPTAPAATASTPPTTSWWAVHVPSRDPMSIT